ncbi:hypothetical protein [Streptomyces flaveus]|uniref:Uncharacterized protein n=1 Tax=Streptomyces flaveus TaxID=66370 RepID=A0A917QNY1_9ACTN|nr:hypothetical protein [Streptomyces flaveus]GGK59553.1 hypothetical protein GCM10010094_19880 [Streptomyces flaveus]
MTPPPDTVPAEAPARSDRADRFARDLAALKIPDPATARNTLWLRTGAVLMLAGLCLGALTYPLAHASDNPLAQRDALAIGITGVVCAVVGGALYLRYSLTGFLRFWLARQAYDLSTLGDRLAAAPGPATPADPSAVLATAEGEPNHGATSPASR